MEINNFLSITNKKVLLNNLQEVNEETFTLNDILYKAADSDSLTLNGKEINLFGDLSDEFIVNNKFSAQSNKVGEDEEDEENENDDDSNYVSLRDYFTTDDPEIINPDTPINNNNNSNNNNSEDETGNSGNGSSNHGEFSNTGEIGNIDDITNGSDIINNTNTNNSTQETSDNNTVNNTNQTQTQTNTNSTEWGYGSDISQMNEAQIQKIKERIFIIHNTKTNFNNDSFDSADTLFDFLSTISNGKITKDTGITKAQLTKLTQNDKWEDSHNDFFGSLNRAFANVKPNEVISYYKIRHLFYTAGGNDYNVSLNEFKTNVENFAKKVQEEFEALTSNKDKLQFLLNKTEEYLYAAGLEDQLAALQRLLGEDIGADELTAPGQDKFNGENAIGQIAIADLDNGNLGGYSSWSISSSSYTYNGETYNNSLWYGDDDSTTYNLVSGVFQETKNDNGITIDSSYLETDWYFGVDALVHELTHATAFIYYQQMFEEYNDNGITKVRIHYPNSSTINKLLNMGIITESEAQTLTTNPESYDFDRLKYLLKTAWGEYIAYQTDADYIDSIAGDVFDNTKTGFEMAVSGAEEKQTIKNYITNNYDNEQKPTSEWWVTYQDDDGWSKYIMA
mgnify:CR=1 FL=1